MDKIKKVLIPISIVLLIATVIYQNTLMNRYISEKNETSKLMIIYLVNKIPDGIINFTSEDEIDMSKVESVKIELYHNLTILFPSKTYNIYSRLSCQESSEQSESNDFIDDLVGMYCLIDSIYLKDYSESDREKLESISNEFYSKYTEILRALDYDSVKIKEYFLY